VTSLKGPERVFSTPPLEAGKEFHYDILVRWKQDGKPVEQKRQVTVTRGARVRVDFRSPSPADRPPPADKPPVVDKPPPADKPDAEADDQEVVNSKSAPRPAAASVPFRKELGLSNPTLRTLGSRIDAARRSHDPVALANAASELDTAEKVSGKKASITSTALMNEAAELATLKRQEAELQQVVKMSDQITTAQNNIATMRKCIALSQEQAKADVAAYQQGQEPTWTPRKVVVNNYTTQYIDVYVNGNFKVTVNPGMTQTFMIDHRWNPTVLTGYGDEDNGYPWKRIIVGRFNKYVWNLN
jgi:uncharacterized protein (TIGR03000 family)